MKTPQLPDGSTGMVQEMHLQLQHSRWKSTGITASKIFGGFDNTLTYKNFDFALTLHMLLVLMFITEQKQVLGIRDGGITQLKYMKLPGEILVTLPIFQNLF